MKLIVNVDKNYGIGNNNELLIRIPDDMKFFRQATIGKAVVMGRKTLESFPSGNPLKDRVNIVLTSNKNYEKKGCIIVHDIDELQETLKEYDSDEVFCIGGESVYRLLLPMCDEAFLTKVDYAYEADAFFPNLDDDDEWELIAESDEQTYYDVCYSFCRYRRR